MGWIAFAALGGFVLGLCFAAFMNNGCNNDIEKSGVWTHNKKAYRLTLIEPEQR